MMRDKYLTEAMGELPEDKKCLPCDGGCQGSGGCHSAMSFRGVLYIDFSTWPGFGKLINIDHSIVPRGYLRGAAHAAIYQCTAENKADEIPDRFANAVYEFLKGRES